MSVWKLGTIGILICAGCVGPVNSVGQEGTEVSISRDLQKISDDSSAINVQNSPKGESSSTSTEVMPAGKFFSGEWNPGPDTVGNPLPEPTSATCYHSGSNSSGMLTGGTQLPERGKGYYYFPSTDKKNTDNWACGDYVIKHIIEIGEEWEALRDGRALIGVGDISWHQNAHTPGAQGGKFPGHMSHQNGLDVDLRYLRKDKGEKPLDLVGDGLSSYDLEATQQVIELFFAHGAELILAHRTSGLMSPVNGNGLLRLREDHRDHFHVRFPTPN